MQLQRAAARQAAASDPASSSDPAQDLATPDIPDEGRGIPCEPGAGATDLHEDAGPLLEQVLDALEQRGLLSDARAAQALLHAKAPRYGARRLRQALLARALPAELVDEAVRGTHASEWARACAVWRRRFGAAPADAREHARQMRFLLARGFEAELARRIIREGAAAGEESGERPDDAGPSRAPGRAETP